MFNEISTHILNETDYVNVVNSFKTNHDNRTSVIAREFNISPHRVSFILNLYLQNLENYMGSPIKISEHNQNIIEKCRDLV